MTKEHLEDVIRAAEAARDESGWHVLPEGRSLTLYAAHDGVPLTISRVVALHATGPAVHARAVKGELYVVATEDLFAAAIEGATAPSRKAGFL